MCGIAGFIDFNRQSTKTDLTRMTDILHHRGPDDSGYYLDQQDTVNIGLGHRRLSILDLSPLGHQPMHFEHLHIVYNGEVYNFAEIRQELVNSGYQFTSDSDTEVILKAFAQWGIEAVHKFNGMFVFAIYNENSKQVTIVRDRAGIKPLYWFQKDGLILFASELKSFHEHPAFAKVINTDAVSLFLHYNYIPEPHTIFQNCRKLQAGHFLSIDLNTGDIQEKQYWNVLDAYNKTTLSVSKEEAMEHLEKLMLSSFEYRMVADVPVGMFLSGGYDSSAVTALLQSNRTDKLKTFTIGFREKGFDEAPYAKQVAQHLGTDHTEYYCTQREALDILPTLPEIFDEPFADSSAIPTILVSRLARQEVTVSLSADAGDELFAGYTKYVRILNYYRQFTQKPKLIKKTIASLMNAINPRSIPFLNTSENFPARYEKLKQVLGSQDVLEVLKLTCQEFSPFEIESLLKKGYQSTKTNFDLGKQLNSNNDDLSRILAIDYKTFMLDDILTKVDRATMSVSLEGREPLLDYRLIEYVATLPSDLKYHNGQKKYLLKEITHKYLPRKIMDRPKMGFGIPITEWFRDELKEYLLNYLDKDRLEKEGIFCLKWCV